MNEIEVNTPTDAATFLAEEVVNEHHMFPVAHKGNLFHIQINEVWYTMVVRRSNSLDMMSGKLS